ncbi:unnamed protein product, partial [marine sediment metagenome]
MRPLKKILQGGYKHYYAIAFRDIRKVVATEKRRAKDIGDEDRVVAHGESEGGERHAENSYSAACTIDL